MDAIRIIEVGPRDGLQNEAVPVATHAKAQFIRDLSLAGLQEIEATSFVSPKWVPQLGDAAELLVELGPMSGISALVPNLKGLARALESGVQRIAVFTAASDAFTHKNIGMSVDESLAVFAEVVSGFRAARPGGFVRGYVSTAFECPYSGLVAPDAVARVCGRLMDLGVDEISLGDTIGVAVPFEVRRLAAALGDSVPAEKVSWHFHDTRGTAIANVAAALDLGFRSFDASAGGLGGCPYARGAGGNLATEDLVYFLERSRHPTGVDLNALARASLPILHLLSRSASSKVQRAVLGR